MFEQRRTAAQEVADRLIAAETAIDVALSAAAELVGYMPQARLHANVAAEIGHEAIERSAAAFTSLINARREIVEAHKELAETKVRIGLRTYALGGLMPKPDPKGEMRHLTMVESEAA